MVDENGRLILLPGTGNGEILIWYGGEEGKGN